MAAALWKVAGATIDFAHGGMIMGVLNVTPDSFSDGTAFFESRRALDQATRMVEEGARIIDVGGESTRPGAKPVPEDEELRRVLPIITKMRATDPGTLISIDTSKAGVAREAINAGANIINDVTGGRGDARMMSQVAESGSGFILMHMLGTPRTMQNDPHYDDVVAEVADFFRQQYGRALECGIDPMAIAFDPGIGFGKTLEHNLELLANLSKLRVENRPLVVGVSRKSSLGKLIGSNDLADRLAPTIALTGLLRERGADVLRVHDVKPNMAALRATEALLASAK